MSFLSNNVGMLDRAVRIAGGLLLIALAAMGSIGPWGYVGSLLLLTAVIGSCPLYTLFGFHTGPDRNG